MASTSVVITNFNYERYLGDAVDSALAQGDGVEVVVVDDGSTDGSVEVIRRYGSRVVPVLQANAGQAAAFNAGFAACAGTAVCFLDADDLLWPGTMASVLTAYEAEPFAKLHWPLQEVGPDGRLLGGVNPPVPLPEGDLRDLVLQRGPGAYPTPPSSGNAFSRRYLEQVLPVPEELRVCADAYLYDLAPLFGRVARLDRPGGGLRFHDGSSFMAKRYDDRLPHSVRAHERTIEAMAERCRQLGIRPDEAGWRRRSWPLRSQRMLADIAGVVPEGTPFVLVDGDRVGVERTAARPLVRLPEHTDADAAVAELRRAREDADVLVVAWPSFPWLARQPAVQAEIRASYRPVLENERLRMYARSPGREAGLSATPG